MNERVRWAITGGCGFVGSNLAAALLARGASVLIVDNMSRPGSERNAGWLASLPRAAGGDLAVAGVDVTDRHNINTSIRRFRPHAVAHLAAQVAVTTSIADPRGDFEVNALGTLNVLEAVREHARTAAFLFASTNKVYGAAPPPGPVAERQPVAPCTPYGCSKAAADQYTQDYARTYGLRTLVARMSCVYGARQFGTEDQGWLAHFAIAAARGEPATIYGDGRQVRDVLHVGDLVDFFLMAAGRLANGTLDGGHVFNVGGGPGNAVAVGDAAGALGLRTRPGPWRPGDQRCYVSDCRKAFRVLGWHPRVGFGAGLGLLAEWARSPDGPLAVR